MANRDFRIQYFSETFTSFILSFFSKLRHFQYIILLQVV